MNFDNFINDNLHDALYRMVIGEIDLDGYVQAFDVSGYGFRIWLYEKNAKDKPRNEYVDVRISEVPTKDTYNVIDYYTGKTILSNYEMKRQNVVDLRTDVDPLVSDKLVSQPSIKKLIPS
jgi:hypothetical protein